MDLWLVIGDLNVMLTSKNKTDELPLLYYELQNLEDVIYNKSLIDLQSVGCQFTWMNGTVSCKMDCVMINTYWLSEDFHGYLEFLASECLLNHSCCVVSILLDEQQSLRPFKFFKMWALHKDLQGFVADV